MKNKLNTKPKTIIGYKSVTDSLKSGHGDCKWKIGEWKKHEGPLKLCGSGFHASKDPYDVLNYVQGDRLFLVEARGDIKEQEDKFVAREMRLKAEIKDFKRLSVEFSIWCAERCLPNYEKKYSNDTRVRDAINAAKAWLKAKTEKQRSAAWSAARSAAESAAESAARSAARSAAESARSAAESAAWSVAWSARSAAESAAWSAESAAWSVAWSARSAAESARSAARKKFKQLVNKYQTQPRRMSKK